MKDFFGQTLAEGDRVAIIHKKYQQLKHGVITKLGSVKATVNLGTDEKPAAN
jgi:hypothetical protein